QRFGEMKHVCLGGVVYGHQRSRLEGSRGGDIEDAAVPPLHHAGQYEFGEMSERSDIELNGAQLFINVRVQETAIGPGAGIVDQDLRVDAQGVQLREDAAGRLTVGQVFRNDVNSDLVAFLE